MSLTLSTQYLSELTLFVMAHQVYNEWTNKDALTPLANALWDIDDHLVTPKEEQFAQYRTVSAGERPVNSEFVLNPGDVDKPVLLLVARDLVKYLKFHQDATAQAQLSAVLEALPYNAMEDYLEP